MPAPQFVHDCPECTYLGTFFGHDVYTHKGADIVARNGNDGWEYASMPLSQLRDHLSDPDCHIGGDGLPTKVMPYREWVFSDYGSPSTKAMVLGLALASL